jgi:hypothetical protein
MSLPMEFPTWADESAAQNEIPIIIICVGSKLKINPRHPRHTCVLTLLDTAATTKAAVFSCKALCSIPLTNLEGIIAFYYP